MRIEKKIKKQGRMCLWAIIIMLLAMFPQIDLLAANVSEFEIDSKGNLEESEDDSEGSSEESEEANDSKEELEESKDDSENSEKNSEDLEQKPEGSEENSEESEESSDSKEELEESKDDLENSEKNSEDLEQKPEGSEENSEESEESSDFKEELKESKDDSENSEKNSEDLEQKPEDLEENSEESEESEEDLEQKPNESEAISEDVKSEAEILEASEIIEDEEIIEIYLPAKLELTYISLGMGADIHSEDIIVWNQGELPLNVKLQNVELWMENSRIYDEAIWLELYQAGKKKKTFSLQEGDNKNVTEFVLTESESTEEILDKKVLEDGMESSDYVVFRIYGSVSQVSESCIEDEDLKIRMVFQMDYE